MKSSEAQERHREAGPSKREAKDTSDGQDKSIPLGPTLTGPAGADPHAGWCGSDGRQAYSRIAKAVFLYLKFLGQSSAYRA